MWSPYKSRVKPVWYRYETVSILHADELHAPSTRFLWNPFSSLGGEASWGSNTTLYAPVFCFKKPGWLSGTALGYGMESRQGLEILLTSASRAALGPTQSIQWVSGAISLGVKRPERKPNHSSQSSAEVRNAWSYTSTPPIALMAWCSVKKSTGTTLPYLVYLVWDMPNAV
jgi:hypothetical protein